MAGCSNNLYYISYTYLKASLIKVVDILFKNTIFYYGILNKIKLLVNNLRILTFYTLIIIFMGIFWYKIIMLFNEVTNPVLSNASK
jgi:hypothetical protein